jgi:hypothetical protein
MPEQKTLERARKAKRQGNSPTTQAGEFVSEEMEHIREGKHGARSTKQAIAIGLSKARRTGVKLPPPKKGTTSEKTRRSAERAYHAGQSSTEHKTNPRRSRAITRVMQREGHRSASHGALSKQARSQARSRSASERSAISKKAAHTRLAAPNPCRAQRYRQEGGPHPGAARTLVAADRRGDNIKA